MGMHNYSTVCENCGREAQAYEETRYIENGLNCPHCGYFVRTVSGFETLKNLNWLRKVQWGLKSLKKLPKQNKNLINK